MNRELLIGELQNVNPVSVGDNSMSDNNSQLILERLKLITDQNNHLNNKLNDLEIDDSNSGGGSGTFLYGLVLLTLITWALALIMGHGVNPIESFPKLYTSITENQNILGEEGE